MHVVLHLCHRRHLIRHPQVRPVHLVRHLQVHPVCLPQVHPIHLCQALHSLRHPGDSQHLIKQCLCDNRVYWPESPVTYAMTASPSSGSAEQLLHGCIGFVGCAVCGLTITRDSKCFRLTPRQSDTLPEYTFLCSIADIAESCFLSAVRHSIARHLLPFLLPRRQCTARHHRSLAHLHRCQVHLRLLPAHLRLLPARHHSAHLHPAHHLR